VVPEWDLPTCDRVRTSSNDFSVVFRALARGPLMAADIAATTGLPPEVVDEVVRVSAMTGAIAIVQGRCAARSL